MGPIPPRSTRATPHSGWPGTAFSQNRPAPSGRAALATFASLSPTRPLAPPLPPRRTRGRHRRFFTWVVVLVLLGAGVLVAHHVLAGPPLSLLRARIVAAAQGQVGYQTDPSDTYCNKFSAYWGRRRR